MNHPSVRKPPGHAMIATAMIGSLALVLAAGLSALGLLEQADRHIAGMLARTLQVAEKSAFPKALQEWALWLATAVVAYGLPLTILNTPRLWRRIVLWVSGLVVMAGWAPVLALAAHAPLVTAPLVAVLWSGLCALVYAHLHQMACDEPPRTKR